MTLTEFLEARIAEDEALAQVATPGQWERDSGWSITAPPPEDWSGPYVVVETKLRNDAEFIASHNPARVLAECEAKRRIMNELGDYADGHLWASSEAFRAESALRALVLPYVDHPDYQPEWRP